MQVAIGCYVFFFIFYNILNYYCTEQIVQSS